MVRNLIGGGVVAESSPERFSSPWPSGPWCSGCRRLAGERSGPSGNDLSMRGRPQRRGTAGFTLVEVLAAVGILVLLVSITAGLMGRSSAFALKTGAENLTAAVEQARTAAITRRSQVVLAVLEPGQGGFDDGQCRLGLFEVEEQTSDGVFQTTQMQRWVKLPGGVAFFGGEVDSLDNVFDASDMTINWRDGEKSEQVKGLVFSPRGGLDWPRGSEPVVLTAGTGTYRDGRAIPTEGGARRNLRIGRVVARPWNLDP